MRQTARDRGFEYDGQARQFQREDFERFDMVVAMDQANRRILERWASDQGQLDKIRLMREFDPQGGEGLDVPDPYYGGPEGFERTYEIVERSVAGLLEALESGSASA
jgi:protein-tyrosine phosphatase